jgi:hypothetical protein
MPLQTNPFEVRNFTGGLTDHQNTDVPNTYLAMDNLLFNADGEIFTRYGSAVYNSARLPSGNQRVSKVINYNNDETLIILSGTRAFYDNTGAWAEILSPSGSAAIPGASAASNFQVAEWKRQTFIASDSQIQPVKIIKDDNLGWRSITAGLPKMTGLVAYNAGSILTQACALANALRTSFDNHYKNIGGSFHPTVQVGGNLSALDAAAAASDLPTLLLLTNALITAFVDHYNDAWFKNIAHRKADAQNVYINTSQSDETLVTTQSATDLETAVARLNDLRQRLDTHMAGVRVHNGRDGVNQVPAGNPFIENVVTGPYVALDKQYLYTAANNIKAKYLAHLAAGGTATTAHSTGADSANNFFSFSGGAAATTADSLSLLLLDLFNDYCGHHADSVKNAGWSYHVAKESADHSLNGDIYTGAFPPFRDYYYSFPPANWSGAVLALNTFANIFNAHVDDWTTHYTTDPNAGGATPANSHDVNEVPNTQPIALANYNYAIVYSYTYTINGVTFQMRSEPYLFSAQGIISIDLEPATIANISPLSAALNPGTNYDFANITIEIYRTLNNGTTYFLTGTLANTGSAGLSYTDSTKDADLVNRATLYTSGGVNSNSLPPRAKFFTISNNFGYYGNFPGNSNRIVQSQPSIIDGVWGANYVDLPYDVAGLAHFRGIPIAWTSNQTYRLEGQFDSLGNGQLSAVPIATNIGLSGSYSPVVYDNGVVFAAQDGFYLTDGYKVQKINTYWRDTYLNLIRTPAIASNIHGVYERNQRRLWWATNTNSADNDSCYVLDANFPVTANAIFTSMNAKAQSVNFAPSSIGYFKGQVIRGDSRGYVFKHDPTYRSDPKVNTGAAPSTWTTAWVTYSYQSPYFDFGTLISRKWNPRVNVKCRNNGNLSLQVNLFTDNATSEISSLSPLYYRGGTDVIEQRGHVPAGYLRCRNRSVQFTNAFVVIQNSDTKGLATLDRVAKTLTLGANWTGDLVDQVVTFPGDGYTAGFTVTAQAGAVLTLSDPGGTLPASGATKWEVRGYPKDELFQLVSYALQVAALGKNQPVMGLSNGANS